MNKRDEHISFIVPGVPVAKGRARMTRAGFAYTPGKTRDWEAHVRFAASQAAEYAPYKEAVGVEIIFALPVPRSFSAKRKAAALRGDLHPAKRPDIDNLGKAVMDAMNAVVYEDDRQIVNLRLRKVYAEVPETRVSVWLESHAP